MSEAISQNNHVINQHHQSQVTFDFLERLLRRKLRADFLTALRATPLIVVIVLDLLDFSLDIFSTPITWAVLTYLRLAPMRLVAVVKDLIPVTNFIPLMTLCWLYARLKNHSAIPSGTDVLRLRP